MNKMIVFLMLLAAPLMAQHATQFAYFSTENSVPLNQPELKDGNLIYSAIAWDGDTQVNTEGITLEGQFLLSAGDEQQQQIIQPPLNTILIHHAGWYLAKFLVSGDSESGSGVDAALRFGLLNLDDSTLIPFSVYGVRSDVKEFEQLAGQVVFYVPANTRIQLVNDGDQAVRLNDPPPNPTPFLTSIYLFELLGR